MKKQIRWLFLLALSGCLLLSGCSPRIASPDSLMRPPHSYGDLELRQAFEAYFSSQNKQATDVILKTPSGGEYRSAYVMGDLDGDGEDEALVFYTLRSDKTICNINMLDRIDGKWETVGTIKGAGSDVSRLTFLSMDAEKTPEILVEWSTGDSMEKNISLLRYDASGSGSSRIASLVSGPVLAVQPVDIDADGYMEIFLVAPGTSKITKNSPKAQLLRLQEGKITILADLPLDSTVSSAYTDVHVQQPYSGQPLSIFLDGSLENSQSMMVTQILYWNESDKQLYNAISAKTMRSQAITTRDINQDGVLEIPRSLLLNGSVSDVEAVAQDGATVVNDSASSVLTATTPVPSEIEMTLWNQFQLINNLPTLVPVLYSAIKFSDSYLFTFPSGWITEEGVNRVTIQNSIADRRWSFFEYDSQRNLGAPLFNILAVPEGEWQKNPTQGYTRINSNGSLVYAVKLEEAAQAWNITLDLVKSNLIILD